MILSSSKIVRYYFCGCFMKQSIRYHQNFIRDPRVVKKIVGLAGFGQDDLVYEIGPGRGIITRELVKTGAKVVAVEIDRRLAERL